MPRVAAGVAGRVRERRNQIWREIVQQAPARGRQRAAIERHLNRRRLPHHPNAERSDLLEVPRHALVSVDTELQWDATSVVEGIDPRGEQRNALVAQRHAQRIHDSTQRPKQLRRRRQRRRADLELSSRLEADGRRPGRVEARRPVIAADFRPVGAQRVSTQALDQSSRSEQR
jgi:hypothetical protein